MHRVASAALVSACALISACGPHSSSVQSNAGSGTMPAIKPQPSPSPGPTTTGVPITCDVSPTATPLQAATVSPGATHVAVLQATLTVHGGDVSLEALRPTVTPVNMDPVASVSSLVLQDDQQSVLYRDHVTKDFVWGFIGGPEDNFTSLRTLKDGVPVTVTVYCDFAASAPSGSTISFQLDNFFINLGPVQNGAINVSYTTNGGQAQTIRGPTITIQ